MSRKPQSAQPDRSRSEHEAVFEGYWERVLAHYGNTTPAEYDAISKQRREALIGKRE